MQGATSTKSQKPAICSSMNCKSTKRILHQKLSTPILKDWQQSHLTSSCIGRCLINLPMYSSLANLLKTIWKILGLILASVFYKFFTCHQTEIFLSALLCSIITRPIVFGKSFVNNDANHSDKKTVIKSDLVISK